MLSSLRSHVLACSLLVAAPALAQEPAQDVPTMDEAQALLQSDPAAAADAFKKIASAEPQNAQAHHMIGYSLHMAGQLDEALEAHLAGAKFDAVRPVCLYNVACVYSLKNEKDKAFEYLGKAREAGFTNPQQIAGDTDMDNLRGDPRFASYYASIAGGTIDLRVLAPASRLDFWAGDWTTAVGDEVFGMSRIQKLFDGCLRQTAMGPGGEGVVSTSTYVYVPTRNVWKQVYVDRDGDHVVLEGRLNGRGDLVMTQVSMNGEPTVAGRSVFSNISTTGFDYQWQTSADGGETWQDGTRVRFERAES